MIAVGIVRQSRGRDESLSPAEQRERIAALCEREGLRLAAVHEEIDVSGFKSALPERHGLSAALHAIEDGTARVLVVAYFDRLFRRMAVQAEVVARVEAAQVRLDTAIATLADLDAEPAALATLRELRDERDRLQAEAHRLGDLRTALVLNAARDWGRLSLGARRELIRAVIERVTVGPGRGAGRLAVTFCE